MVKRGGFTWLASYPKSGNTWLRIFLSSLTGERFGEPDINQLGDHQIASARSWLDEALPFATADLTLAETERVRPLAYWYHHPRIGGAVKVHDAYTYLVNGQSMLAGETVKSALYIVRNPMDVAPSLAHHLGISVNAAIDAMADGGMALSNPVGRILPQVRQRLSSWSAHVASWVHAAELSVHVVRYEDMLDAPLATFTAAAKFLGLHHDRQRIEAAIAACSFDKLQFQEAESGFSERPGATRSFFRHGKAGTWRHVLNTAQIERVVAQHSTMMRRFGYLNAGGPI